MAGDSASAFSITRFFRSRRLMETRARHFMLKAMHLSKGIIPFSVFFFLNAAVSFSAETADMKKNETGFYRDFFDQNVYNENVNLVHLDRLMRKISGKKVHAADANIFDEVPDSTFFTNRHARKPLAEA